MMIGAGWWAQEDQAGNISNVCLANKFPNTRSLTKNITREQPNLYCIVVTFVIVKLQVQVQVWPISGSELVVKSLARLKLLVINIQ